MKLFVEAGKKAGKLISDNDSIAKTVFVTAYALTLFGVYKGGEQLKDNSASPQSKTEGASAWRPFVR